MRLRIALFAVARERAGRGVIEVEVSEGATVADLRTAIAAEYPALATLLPATRIAVNADYARDDFPLPAAAEIALIPPVSGG